MINSEKGGRLVSTMPLTNGLIAAPSQPKDWAESTAGPGTIAMIISSASTVRQSSTFADWVLMVAPPLIFFLVAVILWGSLRSSGAIMRLVGKGGIEAISRLMGFLLVCMGVQFIINGILEIIKTYH